MHMAIVLNAYGKHLRRLIEGIVHTVSKGTESYVDEIFSVMLPTKLERKRILDIHLRKRNRGKLVDSKLLNLDLLVDITENFSGAELEAGIVDALFAAYSIGRELEQQDLHKSFSETLPLAKTMEEKIKKIKDWCKGRTRSANIELVEENNFSSNRKIDA